MTEQKVEFEIKITEGTDANELKNDLEKLANDLELKVYHFRRLQLPPQITGRTNKETYEKIFNAKLDNIQRTISNLNGPARTYNEWTETKKAEVPYQFAGKIKQVGLEGRTYLTD